VLIETAQLFLDGICLRHERWNNTLVAENPQQQVAAGTEIATVSRCRRRTVAARQVAIKEPLNRHLVEALDCKPGPTHPPRKMRDGVDVIRSGAARIAVPHQALDEHLNMRCKLAGSDPASEAGWNEERSIHGGPPGVDGPSREPHFYVKRTPYRCHANATRNVEAISGHFP
jgi:hypothetical protein